MEQTWTFARKGSVLVTKAVEHTGKGAVLAWYGADRVVVAGVHKNLELSPGPEGRKERHCLSYSPLQVAKITHKAKAVETQGKGSVSLEERCVDWHHRRVGVGDRVGLPDRVAARRPVPGPGRPTYRNGVIITSSQRGLPAR